MFSTDNNVETIGRLVEVLKNYIGLQTEYVKLDVIEKIVRLITVLALALVLLASILMIIIFGGLCLGALCGRSGGILHCSGFLLRALPADLRI